MNIVYVPINYNISNKMHKLVLHNLLLFYFHNIFHSVLQFVPLCSAGVIDGLCMHTGRK